MIGKKRETKKIIPLAKWKLTEVKNKIVKHTI